MNRNIKFRVWDNIGKRMYLWPILIDNYIGDNNCILQQFTGTTVKNNKEVYEGDILKLDISQDPSVNKYINAEVVWDSRDLKWAVKANEFGAFPRGLRHFKFECEVIGNIYEK